MSLHTPILWSQSAINWRSPLNRGLVSWWHALPSRMGGTRFFDLCGRYIGTLTSMSPPSAIRGWGPTRRPGGHGELRFNGVASALSMGTAVPTFTSTASFSLLGWARDDYTGSGGVQLFVKNVTATNDCKAYSGFGDGVFYWELGNTADTKGTWAGYGALRALGWYHFALLFNGAGATNDDRMQMYFNGQRQTLAFTGTIPATTGNLAAAPLTFGIDGTSFPWLGAMDDLRLWSRCLSASEVQAVYQASLIGYPNELNWVDELYLSGFPPVFALPRPYLVSTAVHRAATY